MLLTRIFKRNGRHVVFTCRPLCKSTRSTSSDSFRNQLLTYTGGSVDLVKDEQTGIGVITLNNLDKKNAMTGKMMVDLRDTVCELERWHTGKGVILCGAGNTFCSGGDLEFSKNVLTPQLGFQIADFMHNTTTRLSSLSMISVALVQGTALGGGAELLTACDFRLVTEQARVGFVHAKMGLVTGWGGGTRLTRLLGRKTALHVLSTATVLDARECKRVGFADDILPETENSLDLTKTWLQQYCKHQADVVRTFKDIVLTAEHMDLQTSLENEKKVFSKLWDGPLHSAALSKNIKH